MHSLSDSPGMDLKKSTQLRAETFVEGTKFVLEQQGKLTDSISIEMNELLDETKKIIAQEKVELPHYSRIVNRFIKKLSKMSKLTEKNIALGEAYWAWQIYERPERTTNISIPSSTATVSITESVIQPHLTRNQKELLILIHGSPNPPWVKKLTDWEQRYLKKIIPKDINGDWSDYEKVLPATLRRIPGLCNATQRTFTYTNSEGNTVKKRGYRQGVPTAYAMPSSYYQSSAEENIRQMINAIQSNAKENFRAYWKLSSKSKLQAPLLLLGLLTHKEHGNALQKLIDTEILNTGVTLSGEENNTQRTQDKSTAILKLQADYPDIKLIDLNIGVNIGRGWVTSVPVDSFITTAEKLLNAIKTEIPSPSTPQNTHITEAEAAITALKTHNTKSIQSGRNKDLFTAALCHHLTERLGGSALTNCKSAKDRTGVEIIMADAIDIYVRIHGEYPQYDESNEDKRKQFIDIFKAIFDSQHHQIIANDNSPGSQGIKDEGMLDSDIIERLGESYTLGKKIADLNKPKSFFQKNSKIIFRTLLVLGTIVCIGLVFSGVFSSLGVLLGYGVLSVGLPYATSLGLYGGYAAYDARQNALAAQQYDESTHAENKMPSSPVDVANEAEDDEEEEEELVQPVNQSNIRSQTDHEPYYGAGSQLKWGRTFDVSPSDHAMLLAEPEARRTMEEVDESLQTVTEDLNTAALESNRYESKYNQDKQTIQILQNQTEVVMEASSDQVAIYRPLLQANIQLQEKAILFLNALGIPPTDGKENIMVRGGHHDLRQAIREQFKEYRDNPARSRNIVPFQR